MDELTLRLECLRLACTARTGNDICEQANIYYLWTTRGGMLPVYRWEPPPQQDELDPKPNAQPPKSANERMNEKLAEVGKRDKLGLTDAARRT